MNIHYTPSISQQGLNAGSSHGAKCNSPSLFSLYFRHRLVFFPYFTHLTHLSYAVTQSTSLCSATTYADNVALPAFTRVRRAAIKRYLPPAGAQQQTLLLWGGGDPATDIRTDIVSFHRLCSGNYATINQKVDSRSDNCESKAAVKLLLITFWCRVAGDQHPTFNAPSCTSVLFCSLAVLDPRVGHTMDVLSPFIPVLCHSD